MRDSKKWGIKFRNAREIFVDCGAYVGDTMEQYLGIKEGVFNEIYAFKPYPGNVIALSKRAERLRMNGILYIIITSIPRQCYMPIE